MSRMPTGKHWVEAGDAGRGSPGAGEGGHHGGGVKACSGTSEASICGCHRGAAAILPAKWNDVKPHSQKQGRLETVF